MFPLGGEMYEGIKGGVFGRFIEVTWVLFDPYGDYGTDPPEKENYNNSIIRV